MLSPYSEAQLLGRFCNFLMKSPNFGTPYYTQYTRIYYIVYSVYCIRNIQCVLRVLRRTYALLKDTNKTRTNNRRNGVLSLLENLIMLKNTCVSHNNPSIIKIKLFS